MATQYIFTKHYTFIPIILCSFQLINFTAFESMFQLCYIDISSISDNNNHNINCPSINMCITPSLLLLAQYNQEYKQN